jgi:replicative DNA helicase
LIISSVNQSLPFSSDKQDAILGHLIVEPRFYAQARHLVQSEWFIDGYNQKVYQYLTEFFTEFGRSPTVQELKDCNQIIIEENNEKLKLQAKIEHAAIKTQHFKLDALRKELTDWLRHRTFLSRLKESVKWHNNNEPSISYDVVAKLSKELQSIQFEDDHKFTYADVGQMLDAQKYDLENGLTFGATEVDNLINPFAPNGALLRGDTTVLIAPSNVGKTTTLITTILANAWKGKRILFLTHEGRPEDIWQKMVMCGANLSLGELHQAPFDPSIMEKARKVNALLNRFVDYLPMNKPGLTIEDVEPVIRRRQDESIAKTGKGYDLLVCDYPAKLSTRLASKGAIAKRHSDEIVYNYFVQLALEYKFHSLLVIQTNREGSRVNKGQREERLLVSEDVAESWGVITIATNAITINRDPTAKIKNRLTYFIDKSRSFETGWAIVCETDFARAVTHGGNNPATGDPRKIVYYRGNVTAADKIDSLLSANPGQDVSDLLTT